MVPLASSKRISITHAHRNQSRQATTGTSPASEFALIQYRERLMLTHSAVTALLPQDRSTNPSRVHNDGPEATATWFPRSEKRVREHGYVLFGLDLKKAIRTTVIHRSNLVHNSDKERRSFLTYLRALCHSFLVCFFFFACGEAWSWMSNGKVSLFKFRDLSQSCFSNLILFDPKLEEVPRYRGTFARFGSANIDINTRRCLRLIWS